MNSENRGRPLHDLPREWPEAVRLGEPLGAVRVTGRGDRAHFCALRVGQQRFVDVKEIRAAHKSHDARVLKADPDPEPGESERAMPMATKKRQPGTAHVTAVATDKARGLSAITR